jgi:hypothetical protein
MRVIPVGLQTRPDSGAEIDAQTKFGQLAAVGTLSLGV